MKEIYKKIVRFYKNLSIKRKILLVLYMQITIPLILIGFMSYMLSAEIIYKKSVTYSQDILKTIELRLKDYVTNLTVLSQDLLYDKRIYDILNSGIPESSPMNEYENESAINNTLRKMILSRSETSVNMPDVLEGEFLFSR